MPGIFKLALFFCTLAMVSGQLGPGGPGGLGGGPPMGDCTMQCFMNPAVSNGMMSTGRDENSTGLCSGLSINSTEKLDSTCVAFKMITNCTNACPDSPMKKMMLVPIAAQQFVCGDRINDFRKNIPCLPNSCPKMETGCASKCGSIQSSSGKVLQLLGVNQGPGAPPQGPNVTPVPIKEISDAVAAMCTVMSCYMTCGEPIMTKDCGKDAYLFQRDYSWNTFSAMITSLSPIGTQVPWPNECKVFQGTQNTGTSAVTAGPTVQPGTNKQNDQSKTTTKSLCEQSACGGVTTIVPSIVLVLVTVFLAIRDL